MSSENEFTVKWNDREVHGWQRAGCIAGCALVVLAVLAVAAFVVFAVVSQIAQIAGAS